MALTVGVDGLSERLPLGEDKGRDEAVDGDQGPKRDILVAQHKLVGDRGIGRAIGMAWGQRLVGRRAPPGREAPGLSECLVSPLTFFLPKDAWNQRPAPGVYLSRSNRGSVPVRQ